MISAVSAPSVISRTIDRSQAPQDSLGVPPEVLCSGPASAEQAVSSEAFDP